MMSWALPNPEAQGAFKRRDGKAQGSSGHLEGSMKVGYSGVAGTKATAARQERTGNMVDPDHAGIRSAMVPVGSWIILVIQRVTRRPSGTGCTSAQQMGWGERITHGIGGCFDLGA